MGGGGRQVAHSIRTHGLGILHNSVNYTYQFLARKFAVGEGLGLPLLGFLPRIFLFYRG